MDQRAALDRLIRERGEDYSSLSRLIGRNAAYIQQFIKRGTPRQLAEEDRRLLARYFGVSERILGGAAEREPLTHHVTVPQLAVGALAGPGALADNERVRSHVAFDERWLRSLGAGDVRRLSTIMVEGDSMMPTLADGDEILVERSDGAHRLRDGIYVLRVDGALLVKRLAIHPVGRRVTVQSDNPAYGDLPDCGLDEIECIGRVIWAGRKIA